MKYPVILLGAGGHAKVLLDMLFEQDAEVIGVSVPEPEQKGKKFCGIPIIGNDDDIKQFDCNEVELVNGIGSSSSTSLRKAVYEKFVNLGYRFRNVIHTNAVISYEANMTGGGGNIMAGVVINIGTSVGENTIINTGVTVDHDCQIGKHVHLAPGVTLSGNVKIGDCVHVGAGSTIIQGVTIGNGTVIGAGSLVLHDVGDYKLAYGVPAVVKKDLEIF